MPISPGMQAALTAYITTPAPGTNVTPNLDVRQNSKRIADATGFSPGTPEYTLAFTQATINHVQNFGANRVGGQELIDAINADLARGVDPASGNYIGTPPDNNQGDSGGGDSGGGDSGGDTNNNQGGDTNTNIGPVNLDPVTSLIGSPGAGQTEGRSTLMGQTAGLASDIAGVQSAVTPLAGDVGQVKTDVGEVKTGVTNLATNVGTADANTGLFKPIGDIQTDVTDLSGRIGTADTDAGQTDLFAGQAGLAGQISGVGETATAVQGLMGAPTEGKPETLFAGQEQLGQRIGTPGEGQTDLFTGQAGIMGGQDRVIGRVDDVNKLLGREAKRIQDDIKAFQDATAEYQSGATTQRGNIQDTAIANQNALMGQIGGVGLTMNQQATRLAEQRKAEADQFRAAQAPLQQQIANLTSNNQALQNNLQNIGPMGPMASDPRDALIQQLLTRNASLMNNRPV